MSENRSFQEYVSILKRRRLSLIVPSAVVLTVFLLLAVSLPSIYKAKALILIEEQEVPQEYVNSAISNYAAQQVQVIRQRVLTSANIASIIDKFDLYQVDGIKSTMPAAQVAKAFRQDMGMNLVSADTIDPRSGKPTEVAIAFTLAFKYPDPATAQKVVGELVTLFLNENVRERTDQASSTYEFLTSEAERLNEELLAMEAQLAEFKLENEGSLPDQYKFNLSTLERTNREISVITLRIQDLEERKIKLVAEMSEQSPTVPLVLPSGEIVLSDVDRLKSLQTEYRRNAAIYRDNHPDVARLAREIESLEAQLGSQSDLGYLRMQLREQSAQLATLRTKYNDNHHEVQKLERVIDQLKSSIARAESQVSSEQAASVADNPSYVFLKTQLETTESELRSLKERKRQLDSKSAQYESLLKDSPRVEREYQALIRDHESAETKYQETRAKQRDALAAGALEHTQMGQRFTLLEPPALPHKAVSPNRRAIVFLGLVVAVCAGLGIAVLREAMDRAIYGVRQLEEIMGEPPLVAIPYIENDSDIAQHRRATLVGVMAASAGCMLVLLYLHLMVQPLDVIFFVLLNRVGLS